MIQLMKFVLQPLRLAAPIFLAAFIISASVFAEIPAKTPPDYLKSYPAKTYYMLKSGERVVGKTLTSWEMEMDRLKFVEDSQMRLTLFKKPQKILTKLEVWTDEEIKIQNFKFLMTTHEAKIGIEGRRLGSVMKMKIEQAQNTQFKEINIQEPLLLGPTIKPFLLKRGLPKKASDLEANLLEPSALTVVAMAINLIKIEDNRWKMSLKYLSQELESEIDGRGYVLKEVSNLAGLPIVATPIKASEFESLKLQGTTGDLVEIAKVKFPPIDNPRSLKKFAVRIVGVDLKDFELNRHRQSLDVSTLTVNLEKVPTSSMPVQALTGQKGLEKFLEGEATIPVYHAKIQKIAQSLVKGETDLWKRAVIINDYVYKTLEKIPTISVPNALEVLEEKRGDCNEHAVLYTALARAARVPTRTVVGLVYSDTFYGKPGFYYHAWVEVYAGSGWVAIDPTWNQVPADVTHLAFVEGGLDQQVQVTSLMGKIKLEPVIPMVKYPNRIGKN